MPMNSQSCRYMAVFSLLLSFFCLANPIAAQDDPNQATLANLEATARAAFQSGNLQEAIRIVNEEIELRKSLLQSYNYIGNAQHNLAIYYSVAGNLQKAIETENEALQNFNKMRSKDKNLIGTSYGSLATYYYSLGTRDDIERAIGYGEQALQYVSKNTESYINAANLLIVCYSLTGQSEKADALTKSIFKQGRKVFGVKNTKYAHILSNHSFQLAQNGKRTEAIAFAKESMEIYEAAGDTTNTFFTKLLTNTANIYRDNENYSEAITLLERARLILLNTEGEGGINFQQCIGELSSLYAKVGNLEQSNDLLYSMNNATVTKSTTRNAVALTKQAQTYAASGNYSKGISTLEEAIAIYAENNDSIGIADAYITMSSYYYRSRKTDKAIETCDLAVGILERHNARPDIMARAYNNLAIFSRSMDDIHEAMNYSHRAIECHVTIGDTLSTNYADLLGNLAIYDFETGNVDSALVHSIHSYELKRKLLGDNHPDHALTLYNIANYYFKKGDRQKTQEYYHKALEAQSAIVRKNFTHMSTNGRENYWNTKKFVYNMAPVFVYGAQPSDSLILNDAYNAQLFTKGILLNSEIDFKTLLLRSGNQTMLDQYNKLTRLNEEIEELYSKGTVESSRLAEQKQRESVILERTLMRDSKEFGDYTTNMNISAVAIAKSLADDEVAVELFEMPTSSGDNAYFALYLRKDWTAPRFVRLFLSQTLKSIEKDGADFFRLLRKPYGVNHIFDDERAGQMVWSPLIHAWQQDSIDTPVRNIYFSPTGLFYKWGIEYLKINSTERICDLYNVYRLSSTKQLTQHFDEKRISNATLFGGIDYFITPETMRELHNNGKVDYQATYLTYDIEQDRASNTTTVVNEDTAVRSLLGDEDEDEDDDSDEKSFKGEGLRAGVTPLPGTLQEVEDIGECLMQNNIPTNVLLQHMATEENFKGLSGQQQSLVHIATHGFSFGEGRTKDRQALAYLLGRNNSSRDNSMHYSGLLFAGANNVFGKHMKLPKDFENGIITAAEIASLDLRGLDLVVLSACQTGLGDVKDDGVFGLQRGFKKAGAHTILMSLWSVNDNATRIMMTSFYSALMSGRNRHDAFSYAQQQVRAAGYTDPYYWAAFIMLDDI